MMKFKRWLFGEHQINNPLGKTEGTLYIIRFFRKEGLMSIFYKALAQIEYCVSQGYTPYIDMDFFKTMYSSHQGKKNSWMNYFTEPKIFNDRILSYKTIIIGDAGGVLGKTKLFHPYWAQSFDRFTEKGEFIEHHIGISDEVLNLVKEQEKKIDIENCIGCLVRGTDYVSCKPKGHPIQPSVEEIIEQLEKFVKKYDTYIFLVTEDQKMKERLVSYFGNRIVFVDNDIQLSAYKENKLLASTVAEENIVETGQIYLEKLILLSKCKYLVAGQTNGSLFSLMYNKGAYEDVYLFNKGWY